MQTKYRVRNLLRRLGVEVVKRGRAANLLSAHVAQLLDHHEINCVLDVGARHGEYARWLRNLNYTGRIVSFEPVAANLLTLNAAAKNDPNWRVEPYALGTQTSRASINVTEHTVFSSFRVPNQTAVDKFGFATTVNAAEEVEVRTLADVLDTVTTGLSKPRIYLKMDTQGWDLEVLQGAGSRINDVQALQSETSFQAIYEGMPSFNESWQFIQQAGFVMSGLFPVNVDDDLKLIEADCVAIRE